MLQRAREAGTAGLLVLGTDPATSEDAVALAEAEPSVLAAAGCHPHDASRMDQASWERLAELARHPRVAAIGEIGLDFYRSSSPQEAQLAVCRTQLDLAADASKPVAVHCRQAHQALLPLLEAWSQRLAGRLPDGRSLGIMHHFSGDADLAARYVELGFLISIHTSVTYARSRRLQDVARRVGLDALVVETDSPYGAPQSRRGERNEPAYVAEAVAAIAELRGVAIEEVAEATTKNAARLLALAANGAASAATRARGGV